VKQLIFVYNADSSLFAGAKDYLKKITSPATYGCRLCGLTYGAVGEKKEWKDFVNSIKYPSTFLHKDEFFKEYPDFKDSSLPAVFLEDDQKLKTFIASAEINKQKDLASLMKIVKQKVGS